ncbi:predicted protein [Lichtheimia corymbifera JMRC:FSU:9682]|uniref:Uncharacterized protein n=1 Tax=Lichtheimia corymbifera JMRC:FSU:9682 TaxID=1263082 RepID=A0A068SC74_9FUNG|nr:predicted protein [Lichtheimia corymbifera JMRC:FSU:9682]
MTLTSDGDKVDMRVLTNYDGNEYDMMDGEYANSSQGDIKFYQDHRKVLREDKVIFDIVSIKSDTRGKELKRLLVPTFQATGLEGEMMIVKITAAGFYTAQRIGSLPIPHSHHTWSSQMH